MERYLPPFGQDPNGQANRRLVAQAPGQKGATIPSSSEPRRVDTKPLTTDAPLPVWGYEAGDRIVPSRRPGAHAWFGQGRLTRPSSCDRRLRPLARHLETYGRSNGGVWRPSPNEASRLRAAAAARLERGAVIVAIAVTWGSRLQATIRRRFAAGTR